MSDDDFDVWIRAWRAACDAILARLEIIFQRAGV